VKCALAAPRGALGLDRSAEPAQYARVMGYDPKAETAAGPREEERANPGARPPRARVGSGYRYYSAELGRWTNRDPIEETWHLHLYALLDNRSANAIDPHGLAECIFDPDPVRNAPYRYANLPRIAGRRDFAAGMVQTVHMEVWCACHCDEDARWRLSCRLYLFEEMLLNSIFRTREELPSGFTKRGVYGHEQQHIVSMQSLVRDELMPEITRWEDLGSGRTERICERWAGFAMQMGEMILRRWLLLEAAHANPRSPGPLEMVEPIDGVMP